MACNSAPGVRSPWNNGRQAAAPAHRRAAAHSSKLYGVAGRNYLKGRDGDRINAVLAAAGYNFSLLLRWFEELLRALSLILCRALLAPRLI